MAPAAFHLDSAQLRSFRRALLRWYDVHRRELPWRSDRDPYRVWVSEIMLQQTRVAVVLEHYARFLRRFPTAQSLATAREASVLALWSGLGYYHRARHMHQAAKVIARERCGGFPRTASEWSELPGIGRYTAAAIASIAFGEAVAVVDGNVERVLQRLLGANYTGAELWHAAEVLLARQRPGDFNQAMMELGATICTPRAPQCLVCPVVSLCKTRGAGERSAAPARRRQDVNYALVRHGSRVLLVQRSGDSSLMAGMWELPALTAEQVNGSAPLLRLKLSITNTDYRVRIFEIGPEQFGWFCSAKWFSMPQCLRLPLTGLVRKVLARISTSKAGR